MDLAPTSSSFNVAQMASWNCQRRTCYRLFLWLVTFIPTCKFVMCGTEMPGVSSRYIRGWSLTWVRFEERQLSKETTSHPYPLWCRLCPPWLSSNRGRSSSYLSHDGRGGQRWKRTLRWSDLNLLIKLLLPTLGMPITSRVLSGFSARCHLITRMFWF